MSVYKPPKYQEKNETHHMEKDVSNWKKKIDVTSSPPPVQTLPKRYSILCLPFLSFNLFVHRIFYSFGNKQQQWKKKTGNKNGNTLWLHRERTWEVIQKKNEQQKKKEHHRDTRRKSLREHNSVLYCCFNTWKNTITYPQYIQNNNKWEASPYIPCDSSGFSSEYLVVKIISMVVRTKHIWICIAKGLCFILNNLKRSQVEESVVLVSVDV